VFIRGDNAFAFGLSCRSDEDDMVRPISTILSTISLAIFALVMVMWVRSDDARDAWRFRWRGNSYAIASEAGKVGIDNQPAIDDFNQKRRDDIASFQGEQQKIIAALARKEGDALIENDRFLYPNNWAALPPALVRHTIHYWMLAIPALVFPGIWAVRLYRRKMRRAMGQCVECGYDLRASRGRCPECGATSTRL
jgi:hypothetical protein